MHSHSPPSHEQIVAFRGFCESVYRPSETRVGEILATDWTSYPRLESLLADLPRPVTTEALASAALELLREGVDDLKVLFPYRDGHVTPVEVFELHVLEGRSWPAVQALLSEQGRPHARGTLIRKQHELVPYLLNWIKESHANQERPPASAVPGPPPGSGSRSHRLRLGVSALLLLAAAVVGLRLDGGDAHIDAAGPGSDSYAIRSELRGRRVAINPEPGAQLPAPYPPFVLPDLEHGRLTALLIEKHPGEPRVLLAHEAIGGPSSIFRLWDPHAREILWSTTFVPPREERLTHASVGTEVLTESYWTANVFHGGSEGDLGAIAAFVLIQKYSPTFVVYVNIESGEIVGYYVHPGQINRGIVIDIDQDGACELVLAGQDNALNLPVVVALTPGPGRTAASTVAWNSTGLEGAFQRLLLPTWPAAADAFNSPRLEVVEVEEAHFDHGARVLTVGIGAFGQSVYHARIGPGLVPDADTPLVLWDSDDIAIETMNLGEPPFAGWADQFKRINGSSQP